MILKRMVEKHKNKKLEKEYREATLEKIRVLQRELNALRQQEEFVKDIKLEEYYKQRRVLFEEIDNLWDTIL